MAQCKIIAGSCYSAKTRVMYSGNDIVETECFSEEDLESYAERGFVELINEDAANIKQNKAKKE